VRRLVETITRRQEVDLEAYEFALRKAALAAGAKVLEGLLSGVGRGNRKEEVFCKCGARMKSKGHKAKGLITILGPLTYRRSLFVCPVCGRTRFPGDALLDIEGTTRSPGVRRMISRVGQADAFKKGREDLKIYAGITVSAKDVERVAEGVGMEMEAWSKTEREELCREDPPEGGGKSIPVLYVSYDGTGIPMVKQALAGRRGKQPDGTARTREVKLGCVFTQTHREDRGAPRRDADSTSYVGAIETAETFGWRIYAEAVRRGLHQAKQVVVLGDGARWIKNLADLHFPGATHIIDLYHAREHVAELCRVLFPLSEKDQIRYRTLYWTWLDEGGVKQIVEDAGKRLPDKTDLRKRAEQEMAYLKNNRERMRYADFRKQGLFVGSGVIEAGCKTVIGKRLKQSGMEWSLKGANAIIALRCMIQPGRFEEFWEQRAA